MTPGKDAARVKLSASPIRASARPYPKNEPTFPLLTIHDLRHTAASIAIQAGANVKAVQRMLEHASAKMTLDTYADLFLTQI
ncbi:tyrosine-type recombinase/integrase [Corynebacterium sp. ACRPH]|uniref:tyrosine-type recombinase/integrase n=1 Tax=Corynebacterium sp. ACRPH TaxID=2918199 RepID=UPI00351D290F